MHQISKPALSRTNERMNKMTPNSRWANKQTQGRRKENISLNLGLVHFLLDCIITCILRLRWIWVGTSWPVKLSVVLLFPRYRHSIRCSIREINLIYNYNCIFPFFMVNEQLGLNIILVAEKLSLHIQLFSTVKCKPKRRLIVTFFLKKY